MPREKILARMKLKHPATSRRCKWTVITPMSNSSEHLAVGLLPDTIFFSFLFFGSKCCRIYDGRGNHKRQGRVLDSNKGGFGRKYSDYLQKPALLLFFPPLCFISSIPPHLSHFASIITLPLFTSWCSILVIKKQCLQNTIGWKDIKLMCKWTKHASLASLFNILQSKV